MAYMDAFAVSLRNFLEVSMRRSIQNLFPVLRQYGLTMPQFGAMMHIHTEMYCGVGDLGGQLGVTTAAASQLVERLVQQGLITRTEDPEDRRVKNLQLTEQGKMILQEIVQARQSWLDDLAMAFTSEEKEPLTTALNFITEKAVQLEPVTEIEKVFPH